MTFDWKSYLDLADELTNCEKTAALQEAYFRTAISRAYYRVYHLALNNLLARRDVPPPPSLDRHKYVRDTFKDVLPSRIEKKIGIDIDRLWRERRVADYNADVTINFTRADASLITARQVVAHLESLGTT